IGRAGRGHAYRCRTDRQRLKLARTAGRAGGLVVVVGGSGDLSAPEAAGRRAGTYGDPDSLRSGDASGSRWTDGGVSGHALGEHFEQIAFRIGLSDRLWFDRRVHV